MRAHRGEGEEARAGWRGVTAASAAARTDPAPLYAPPTPRLPPWPCEAGPAGSASPQPPPPPRAADPTPAGPSSLSEVAANDRLIDMMLDCGGPQEVNKGGRG